MPDAISDKRDDSHSVDLYDTKATYESISSELEKHLGKPDESSLSEAKYFTTDNGRTIRVATHDPIYWFEDSGVNLVPGLNTDFGHSTVNLSAWDSKTLSERISRIDALAEKPAKELRASAKSENIKLERGDRKRDIARKLADAQIRRENPKYIDPSAIASAAIKANSKLASPDLENFHLRRADREAIQEHGRSKWNYVEAQMKLRGLPEVSANYDKLLEEYETANPPPKPTARFKSPSNANTSSADTTARTAFNPREWDKKLKLAIAPELLKAMHEGAAAEEALKLYAFSCKAARGEPLGIKFNENHDESGRFASGGGSTHPGAMSEEEFKRRWSQSARTEQGLPLSKLSKDELQGWTGIKPDQKEVDVHRGSDAKRDLEPGDFVTTDKEYAKKYGENVSSQTVPVDHLRYYSGSAAGNATNVGQGSPPELIYAPPTKAGEVPLHQQYHSYEHARAVADYKKLPTGKSHVAVKRTSATDYVEKLKDEFGIDIDELGFDTEPPQWFLEAAFNRLEETFALEYWEGINDTTLGNIETAIKNGIEGGLSMREIADGIMDEGEEFSKSRAMAIARTECGGALNGGAEDGIRQMGEETGLPATKVWLSIFGPTTRDDHAEASDQEVPVDDAFIVGGEEARFPGDPELSAAQRINCQCGIISGISADELGDSDAEPPDEEADAES